MPIAILFFSKYFTYIFLRGSEFWNFTGELLLKQFSLTDFISLPNSLLQVFKATFIFNKGFKLALGLALSHRFFTHNLLFVARKWLLESLTSLF